MQRILFFAYGLMCYVMFLGVFAYAAGFIGNFLVPRTLDVGPETPLGWAILINIGLLALFGVQHSVMARPTFKRWWTRFVPKPIERSTYVLATNLVLILLFWQWRPVGPVVWEVEQPLLRGLLLGLFAAGWLLVFAATAQLNHFDLFGLRQVWLHLRGKPYTRLRFQLPILYRFVRHPLYVGWLLAFWATPVMTAGHLLFAAGLAVYILIAIQFEERNLVQVHGHHYAEYRRRVPMLIPRVGRGYRGAGAPVAEETLEPAVN